MASRMVVTDVGRTWLTKFLERYPDWTPAGYRLFAWHRFGEGGFENVGGSNVPKDPNLFVANIDLEIVQRPGDYPGASYSTPSPGIAIDIPSEIQRIPDPNPTEILQVTARLEFLEEFDEDPGVGVTNPTFFECGIFDNAFSMADPLVRNEDPFGTGVTRDNMIFYGTFDGFAKTDTREIEIRFRVPFKP